MDLRKASLVKQIVIESQAAALGFELPTSTKEFAIVINGLGNGLAIESLVTPEEVPDDLYGFALVSLFAGAATAGSNPAST